MFLRSLLPKATRERLKYADERTKRAESLTDYQFGLWLAYCYSNTDVPRHWDGSPIKKGSPIYDATLHHILIPVAVKRLTGLTVEEAAGMFRKLNITV